MLEPTDRDLLRAAARGDAAAFSHFYRRYVRVLLAFFVRRTGDPVIAADLAAETFATVVERCKEPEHEDAASETVHMRNVPAASLGERLTPFAR
jgi:DNA-directed RNA polymerase specialized sigma24 family protein